MSNGLKLLEASVRLTNRYESYGGDLLSPSVGLGVKHEHVVHGLVLDGLAAKNVNLLVDDN